ncbi:MAG: hypothetical protein U0835_18045 [Isosphaeraceae bacterium]
MFDGIHQEMLHNKIDAFSKAFQGMTVGGGGATTTSSTRSPTCATITALAGVLMSPALGHRTLDLPEPATPRPCRG